MADKRGFRCRRLKVLLLTGRPKKETACMLANAFKSFWSKCGSTKSISMAMSARWWSPRLSSRWAIRTDQWIPCRSCGLCSLSFACSFVVLSLWIDCWTFDRGGNGNWTLTSTSSTPCSRCYSNPSGRKRSHTQLMGSWALKGQATRHSILFSGLV